jgi:CDP-glycerol glycerophosphotransferase (TagB/SpsB family)
MIKNFLKKVSFWNKLSFVQKEKIKTLFGFYTSKVVNPYNIKFSDVEIAIFFSDELDKKYQIEQWLDVFSFLNSQKKILFIFKDRKVLSWIQSKNNFSIVYYQNLESLTEFYSKNNIKVILYVNNGLRNFHSLMNSNAFHVHINHGESDKTSTLSNQAKAYDYSFVVGDAGYDKYKLNLLKKDMSKFIKIGRPQLDFVGKIDLKINAIEGKKVILYAPTWEGNYSSMNFSSLGQHGLNIVQKLLSDNKYYLVYKPHPTTGMRDISIKDVNSKIIKLLNNSSKGEVVLEGDINALYNSIDLAIFDNSAVAIDYLCVDKPMLMTDMFANIKDRVSQPIISRASRLLSDTNVEKLLFLIDEELKNDTLYSERNRIKEYFLGNYDYSKKESSRVFVSKIDEICRERDALVHSLNQENRDIV